MVKRENNYDLLRLISCLMVIFIHASSGFKSNLIIDNVFVGNKGIETIGILAYNVLPRFSVAIFFMISGGFILDDIRNRNIRYFYHKIFTKLFIPAFIFYVFYFLLVESSAIIQIIKYGYPVTLLFEYLVDFLAGAPSSHLWTMTILFVIYLLVPLIMIIINRVKDQTFRRIVLIYFILALLSAHSSYYTFYWSIGMVLDYLGYFLLGYVMRTALRRNRKKDVTISLLLALLVLVITLFIQYDHTLKGIQEYAEAFQIIDPFSPLVCISSILVFYAFSNMEVKLKVYPLSKHSFIIYLAHVGIIQALLLVNNRFNFLPVNPLVSIPLIVLITFVLSIIVSILTKLIINKLYDKYHLSDKIFHELVPLIDKVEQINDDIFKNRT